MTEVIYFTWRKPLFLSFVAKAAVTPPPTERLGQLFNSEITLESDGFIG